MDKEKTDKWGYQKDNLIYYLDEIKLLRKTLGKCNQPYDLVNEWKPFAKIYNLFINKDFLLSELKLKEEEYGDNICSNNEKLAYHLGTNATQLKEALIPYKNRRYLSDDVLKRFELILGLSEGELTQKKQRNVFQQWMDFGILTTRDTTDKNKHINIEEEYINYTIYDKFMKLDDLDCYRLASEMNIYFQIDRAILRKYYKIDNYWKCLIDVLLHKLDDRITIADDMLNNQLMKLIKEDDCIIMKDMEFFKHEVISMEVNNEEKTHKRDFNNIKNKSIVLKKDYEDKNSRLIDIKKQLSLLTINRTDDLKKRDILKQEVEKITIELSIIKDQNKKLSNKMNIIREEIKKINPKITKAINNQWKDKLFNVFWSTNKDFDLKFDELFFNFINDKNRSIYHLFLYLKNRPSNSTDYVVHAIYSMIENTLDLGYREYLEKKP